MQHRPPIYLDDKPITYWQACDYAPYNILMYAEEPNWSRVVPDDKIVYHWIKYTIFKREGEAWLFYHCVEIEEAEADRIRNVYRIP